MRRMKQHGEFHVCHFTDVADLADFYRHHRREEEEERPVCRQPPCPHNGVCVFGIDPDVVPG